MNSLIIGAITVNDCADVYNQSTVNIVNAGKAVPTVAPSSSSGNTQGRCGIVFPYISPDNKMPAKPWTGVKAYPSGK